MGRQTSLPQAWQWPPSTAADVALLGGEALRSGEGVGQVGAEPSVLLLEGGNELGAAVPPGHCRSAAVFVIRAGRPSVM